MYLKGLQQCNHVGCVINHLLALRNIALPQHLPVLVEYVKKGGILGLMALEAMKEIGEQHFTKEVSCLLIVPVLRKKAVNQTKQEKYLFVLCLKKKKYFLK